MPSLRSAFTSYHSTRKLTIKHVIRIPVDFDAPPHLRYYIHDQLTIMDMDYYSICYLGSHVATLLL